ncbi:MAG: hypothetical protein GY711_14520 [bacterium]|nr:hypothetical protein [bacterium]
MTRARWISWLMLAVWASWLTAAQSVLVAKTFLGAWVPDVGLLFVVVCASRFETRDVPRAALLLGVVRSAYTVESPAAVLAGFLAASLVVHGVRTYADVAGPLARAALAASLVVLFDAWLVVAESLRGGADAGRGASGVGAALLGASPSFAAGAIATAIVGIAFGGALTHLPGLTPLRRPRW